MRVATSSIDLDGMAALIATLETASHCLHTVPRSMRAKADRLDVPTTALTRLEQIAAWADDELPGLRRRLNLAIAADAQRPTGLRGTPVQITEPTMSMEQATELGRDLAGRLEAADLCDDAAVFEAVAAEVAAHAGDPDVMSALVQALGAQGLLEVMNRVAIPPQNAVATIDTDDRASLLAALKAGLATADTMWSADQSAQFATALVEASTGDESCSVLSYLLYESRYSDAFLSAAAEAVDAFDRTGWDGAPGRWSPDALPGYWALYFPDGAAGAYGDPVVSLMTALAEQPEVAQRFFAGGPTATVELDGQDLQVGARLQYYIQDRGWAGEDASGEALGRALEAATTALRDRSESGRLSAQIASQAFALMGEKTGQVDDFGETWEIPVGMRPHVAQMLASYATDMQRISDGEIVDDWSDGFATLARSDWLPEGMPYGAAMDMALMERIVGTLGRDQGCLDVILAGAVAANTLLMSTAFAAEMDRQQAIPAGQILLDNGALDGVKNTVGISASFLGWIVEAAYQGDAADEAATKARRERFAAALSAAASLPVIPKIEPAMIQWTLDQLRTQAIDAFKSGVPQDALDRFSAIDDEVPEGCKDQVMNLLAAAEYFGPESYQGDMAHTAPPEDAFIDGSDPPQFDLESGAYLLWLHDHGPNDFLDARVTVPYNDVWSNLQ